MRSKANAKNYIIYSVTILLILSLSTCAFPSTRACFPRVLRPLGTYDTSLSPGEIPSYNRKQTRISLRYTSEALEGHSSYKNTSILNSLRSFFFVVRRRWFELKRYIRASTEKYTIYVLQCENGKFYVGSTANRKQRFREHFHTARSGSKWTRMHKPMRVMKQYKRVSEDHYLGLEAKVTATLMWKHGVNNVRGAFFSQPRMYTQDDIDALRGFLGHFNCLSFAETSDVLKRTLPPGNRYSGNRNSIQNDSKNFRKVVKSSDRCYKCGHKGHWQQDCPKGIVAKHKVDPPTTVHQEVVSVEKNARDVTSQSDSKSSNAYPTIARGLAESAVRIELERRIIDGQWDDDFDPNNTTFQ